MNIRLHLLLPSVLLCGASARADAQLATSVEAGGEHERYERALQLVGVAPTGQWTVRPFSGRELSPHVGPHPWKERTPAAGSSRLHLTTASVSAIVNSHFPFGFNDGAVWAGRGVTTVASAGVAGALRGFSWQMAPVAFITQNASFETHPDEGTGLPTFADWRNPGMIDIPQRFGSSSYGRIDPGETWLRLDAKALGIGLSNQAQIWGPAVEQPIVLGNNSGGFPHLFVGTNRPVGLRMVSVHAKMVWGAVAQSAFGVGDAGTAKHFVTGAVGSLSFRKPRGLELGAARFFHTLWGNGRVRDVPWLRNFDLLFKNQLRKSAFNPNGDDANNQLASLFFRLAPTGSGFELYGEYGREDHAGDVRDFAGEPDHDAAYTLGFQRGWRDAAARHVSVLRLEILNARLSHLTGQSPWYVHTIIRQGHTNRGQSLGAAGGYGGGASTLAHDRYTPDGRVTLRLDRLMLGEARFPNDLPDPARANVVYAATVERVRFTRRGAALVSAGVVRGFNHPGTGDGWNLTLKAGLSGAPAAWMR